MCVNNSPCAMCVSRNPVLSHNRSDHVSTPTSVLCVCCVCAVCVCVCVCVLYNTSVSVILVRVRTSLLPWCDHADVKGFFKVVCACLYVFSPDPETGDHPCFVFAQGTVKYVKTVENRTGKPSVNPVKTVKTVKHRSETGFDGFDGV